MTRNRLMISILALLPSAALATQQGPVYVADPEPVVSTACNPRRVQIGVISGQQWCCVSGTWRQCSSNGSYLSGDASSSTAISSGSTTARALKDRFADTISVKDFGAKGDGVTDDTSAIQAAATASFASHQPLHVPAGRYKVTGPIVITGTTAQGESFTMIGEGADPRFYNGWSTPAGFAVLDASGVAAGAWPAGRSMLEFVDLNHVTLRGLWFLGNGTGIRNQSDATTNGVAIGSSATAFTTFGHHIEYCGFQLNKNGLDLSGGTSGGAVGYSQIIGNNFTNNWNLGAWLNGGDTQFVGNYFNESSPANTTAEDWTGAGLLIAKGLNVSVIGGKIEWNSKGILLYNAGAVLIAGVLTDRNAFAVVGISTGVDPAFDVRGIAITGNRFLASSQNHMVFEGSNSPHTRMTFAITGNVFAKGGDAAYDENTSGTVGPASNSIYFSNAGTYIATISGNSLESAATANGVSLAGDASSRFRIKGNTGTLTVTNAGSGIVDFDGTGTDAQDGASFTVGGVSATGVVLGHAGINTSVVGGFSPPTDAGASQTGRVFQGSGAPNNANGSNGDTYLRTDTPGTANQRVYIKSAGSWIGIL